MTTESAVVSSIFEYLLYKGALVIRVNSGAAQPDAETGDSRFVPFNRWQVLGGDERIAGVSDIIALLPGLPLAVEAKAPGREGNVSEAQRAFGRAWRECGGVWVVASSIDDVERVVEVRV